MEEKKPDNASIIFEKVEIDPSFPGGDVAWKKFLAENLNASVAVQNHASAGGYTVFIRFIVHIDGHISDFKPLTNHGFGMENEALRIIKKGPNWLPAIQNGKKATAYQKQRIDFVVKYDGRQNQSTSINNNSKTNK